MRDVKFILVFLLSLTAACNVAQVQSASNPKALSVIFSKTFENASISKVAFSENGRLIVSAEAYHNVHVLSVDDFKSLGDFKFSGSIANAQLVDNGKVFMANQDGVSQIMEVIPQKKIFEYKFPRGSKHAAISRDMNYIAYGGYVYDVKSGKQLNSPVIHAVQSALQFYDTNSVLTAGYRDQRIILRSTNDSSQRVLRTPNPITVATVVKNQYIVAGTSKGDCIFWNIANNKAGDQPEQKTNIGKRVDLLATDPQKPIIAISADQLLDVFSLSPFRKLFEIKTSDQIRSIAIKGGFLALGEDNGTLQLWNFANNKMVGEYRLKYDPITSLDMIVSEKNYSSVLKVVAGTYKGQLVLLTN